MNIIYLVICFAICLNACNNVSDSNNNISELKTGFQLVYRDTNNRAINDHEFDSIGLNRIIYGRLIYSPGFQIQDSLIFNFRDTVGTLLMNENSIIHSSDTASKIFYSLSIRTYYAGKRYSTAKLYRHDSLIWIGYDTILVKE